MKSLSIILSSLLCAVSPMAADVAQSPKSEKVATQFQTGAASVEKIRMAYENGDYDSFLKGLDASFQKAQKENELQGLAEMRKTNLALNDEAKWNELSTKLQNEKNQELLNAIADKDTPFAEKVRNLATAALTPEQEIAFDELAKYRHIALQTGKNDDENALIALDLEYEYKALQLDSPLIQGQSVENRREKQLALGMERMDRLNAASQQFSDDSLKQTVQLASSGLDARLAQKWDAADLNAFAKGKNKPASREEEKVVSILLTYQEKFRDLSTQFIENQN